MAFKIFDTQHLLWIISACKNKKEFDHEALINYLTNYDANNPGGIALYGIGSLVEDTFKMIGSVYITEEEAMKYPIKKSIPITAKKSEWFIISLLDDDKKKTYRYNSRKDKWVKL